MLDRKLEEYAKTDYYPFHMPGHKRQVCMQMDAYQMDITEIDGFDNLHQPEQVIRDAMEELTQLYHSRDSYLLINGSTAGNLAAVFAVTQQGDSIIIGRNCHKSVYHAAELRQLQVEYTHPEVSWQGIITKTPLTEYEEAIACYPQAKAIVVTSPTYEGSMEDLENIVTLAHQNHMIVIVDAAHGAHLGFCEDFPASPLESGADLVIMSLHKTLPALTQTAVLHVNVNAKVSSYRIQKYLSMFQTSSPSYVLMASICQCITFLKGSEKAFFAYAGHLDNFYDKCRDLLHLRVTHLENQDKGKIIIDTSCSNITGFELQRRMREEFHIELEMASFYYGLAMTSVMDTEEGFARLYDAIATIDGTCAENTDICMNLSDMFEKEDKQMEIHEAAQKDVSVCMGKDAVGKISAEMISIYPPAIPLIAPGEVITGKKMEIIEHAMEQGLNVTGLQGNMAFLVVVN